jgi:hypothetical protein
MPVPSDPFTFTTGQTADATQVNARFNPLYAALNAALDASNLANGAVTAAKLAELAVTNAKLAANAVANINLADGAVSLAKLADAAVGPTKLADLAVTGAKIADATIALAKLAFKPVTSSEATALRKVRGRVNASGGVVLGSGFSVTKGATGLYTINFAEAFPAEPVIVAMASSLSDAVVTRTGGSVSSQSLSIYRAVSQAAADTTFDFIAVGAA